MKKDGFSFSKVLKIISKVISWAFFMILIVAAIFLLYYFIATKIYAAKGAGYEPKFSIYMIASGSMTPNINVYDVVVNKRVSDANEIKVGDVITFISSSVLNSGTTVTHRVIAITTDEDGNVCYQTKGDFNPVEDQTCAKYSNLIGKVILRIPQLGRVQVFLATKAGWILCILIPALYVIIRDIMRIFKLGSIKSTASKMNEKKDPKKEAEEKKRKEELKRKLLKENNNDTPYVSEPKVKVIDKRKVTSTNNNSKKKKGQKSNL